MINTQVFSKILNDLRATESRSLVHHLDGTAGPYVTVKTYRIWRDLHNLTHVSEDHVQRLENLLASLDLSIDAVTFDIDVANYHYIALDCLLPSLVEQKQQQIAAYESALAHAGNDDVVNSEIGSLLSENRQHLEQVRSLQNQMPNDQPATYKP